MIGIFAAIRISCLLGMLGSLAAIYAFLFVSFFKISMGRPVALIAVCLLFDAGAKFVSTFVIQLHSEPACRLTALFVEATSLSSGLWMLFLTLQLFLVVSNNWSIQQIRETDYALFIASIVVPYAVATALFFVQVAGQPVYGATVWICWVRDDLPVIQLLSLTVPLLIAFALVILSFGVMLQHVYKQGQVRKLLQRRGSAGHVQAQEQLNRFILNASVYISVFLLFWTPTTISHIYHAVYGNYGSLPLYSAAILSACRGVFNFALFAFLAQSNASRQQKSVVNLKSSLISEFKMRKRSLKDDDDHDISPTALLGRNAPQVNIT